MWDRTIILDFACDCGVSNSLDVLKTAALMTQRGIAAEAIRKVTYCKAIAVYGLSGAMRETEWTST
jgi:predicted metal-dependent TIM-barrel fold hydrolase